MKIAVTYENEEIFQHFGHCEAFKLYETEDGKVHHRLWGPEEAVMRPWPYF